MAQITVLYCITPDTRFRTMAAASIYTLLRHNPGTPIRVTETDGGDYPIGIKYHALQEAAGKVDTPWTLFIDADTHIHGRLDGLLPPRKEAEFCARRETLWTTNQITHEGWGRACDLAGVPPAPVFNSGLFLLRTCRLAEVAESWPHWIGWLPKHTDDPLCRRKARTRYPWWMLEQCALSLAIAQVGRSKWAKTQHSYQWNKEAPGIVHHFGSKRWTSPL